MPRFKFYLTAILLIFCSEFSVATEKGCLALVSISNREPINTAGFIERLPEGTITNLRAKAVFEGHPLKQTLNLQLGTELHIERVSGILRIKIGDVLYTDGESNIVIGIIRRASGTGDFDFNLQIMVGDKSLPAPTILFSLHMDKKFQKAELVNLSERGNILIAEFD